MSKNILSVREIEKRDIDKIVQYWVNATPEYLTGMAVDLSKFPTRAEWEQMFTEQLSLPIEKKRSYHIIWQIDGEPVGHSNINKINIGEDASMHLHMWHPHKRIKGMGAQFVKMCLRYYFEKYKLKKVYCEPYAFNPGPNKTLEKIGFSFIKKYKTMPGGISAEQEVNRWELSYEAFSNLS